MTREQDRQAVLQRHIALARETLAGIEAEDAAGGEVNYIAQAGRLQGMLKILLEDLGGER